MFVVQIDGHTYGPFEDEDACYLFAAQVSQEVNDWLPILIEDPDDAPRASC